jgi:hypothetical protein
MYPDDDDRVWLSIEILKATNSVTLRGSMLESDLNKILAGTFENKFVEIRDTHWASSVKINNKNGIKFIAYGKDGEWKWHSGVSYLIVERIISMAVLKDVSFLVESEFENVYESNL